MQAFCVAKKFFGIIISRYESGSLLKGLEKVLSKLSPPR
jgi:hypothetical protein